jgi:hypothetical protein
VGIFSLHSFHVHMLSMSTCLLGPACVCVCVCVCVQSYVCVCARTCMCVSMRVHMPVRDRTCADVRVCTLCTPCNVHVTIGVVHVCVYVCI